ncbi:hypothetical protein BU14_1188s0002 [Porphyra umbilicalis]|uniref:Uncharacterized protein n=1 Tax=Porphyra umbilicalis TaxID=2786 RepID=A0A1X6NM81_PORUM|nr:hypothetical protein BU14_1188s0002 [Porphyra umbilicalis]|eukprot:OSX69759.1 hypothetical protein BU14_1188s0002 [Porphyra umbilicalis]
MGVERCTSLFLIDARLASVVLVSHPWCRAQRVSSRGLIKVDLSCSAPHADEWWRRAFGRSPACCVSLGR